MEWSDVVRYSFIYLQSNKKIKSLKYVMSLKLYIPVFEIESSAWYRDRKNTVVIEKKNIVVIG